MKTLGYSDELIVIVKRKCIFPYEHVTNKSVLQKTSLPSKKGFNSKLEQSTISDEDYKFTCDVFKE